MQIGDPSPIASDGDGCGAAMRTAPVGVFYPSSRLEGLIRGAYECAIPTHGGQMAVCAAAAVAGAVSAAREGSTGRPIQHRRLGMIVPFMGSCHPWPFCAALRASAES